MISRIQLRQFLAVVDAGNFTRAAHRLNVAQPSLSAGIAQLERFLGTKLFVRQRKRIRLTDAGNRLLPYARSIERDFRLAEVQISQIAVPHRPIRLGVLESIAANLLERAVANYEGSEPLELIEGGERELVAALLSGAVDVALTLVHPEETRFESRTLFEEGYRLALPCDHPLSGVREIAPSEVAGDTMLARRSCEVLGETSRFFTERGIRPRFALRSAREDRVLAMVRAGLGITLAPESFRANGIAMVPLSGFEFRRSIGLLYGADFKAHYGDADRLTAAFFGVESVHAIG